MDELKLDIFGRVQGVGFRQFVKKLADRLGLKGYVRNSGDGRVFAVVQGERKTLNEFLSHVQEGPFLASVSGVSYLWKRPAVSYPDFVISLDRGFIRDQQTSFTNLGKHILNTQLTIPNHIAIIPDGNRRWARGNGLHTSDGYKASITYDNFLKLFNEAKRLGIQYFTLWGFSTENWDRDKKEINILFKLARRMIKDFRNEAVKNEIRFRHLGRRDRLPRKLIDEMKKLEEETKHFNKHFFQLCLDYGGRDELTRAVNKILKTGVKEVSEEDLTRNLDTEGIPDPDLVIRTSGELRMSGFMPFQGTYSEYYFAPMHFPDFTPEELRRAVIEFSRRKRNFGK